MGQTTPANAVEPESPFNRRLAPHSDMVYDGQRGVFVFYGGPTGTETWEGDGFTWTQRSSEGGPGPRLYFTMSHDEHRGVTVLFGGRPIQGDDAPPFGDTWEWEGHTWAKRSDDGPRPRCCQAMVFDAARGVTVLFGGHIAGGELMGDTWEWDGNRWLFQGDDGPSPRVAHGMAYDRKRQRIVLNGGIDRRGADIFQPGTWEWDGWEWSRRPAVDPPPRYGHSMFYDDGRGVTLMVGGSAPEDRLQIDARQWDGDRWTPLAAIFDLPDVDLVHIAYDSRRQALVCFEKPASGGTILGAMHELTDAGWTLSQPASHRN
jgi:hypothetical protein